MRSVLSALLLLALLPMAERSQQPNGIGKTRPPSSPVVEQQEPLTLEEEIDRAVEAMSKITGIPTDLIHGIIRVENPMMDPSIVNWYGATGLMQVVPRLHAGDFPECGDDLTDVFTNICYGVSIFEYKLQIADGDVDRALLYYNGCWGATYKQGCEVYPSRVQDGI